METVFLSIMLVLVVLFVGLTHFAHKAEEREIMLYNVNELRRVLADVEKSYDQACARFDREHTDEALSSQKRASSECRYWRDRLREHEQIAREAGLAI